MLLVNLLGGGENFYFCSPDVLLKSTEFPPANHLPLQRNWKILCVFGLSFFIYDNQIEFFFLQKSSIPFTQVRLAAQAREASSISYIIKPTFTGFIQFYIRILKPV